MQLSGSLLLLLLVATSARADLTFVQKVEGSGDLTEITIKVKGDKVRMDVGKDMTTLLNSTTGDITTLMHESQMAMRISGKDAGDLLSSAMELIGGKGAKEEKKATITPTGRKENINGYEAEEYTVKASQFSGSYWISTKYPGAAEIMKQLHAATPQMWGGQTMVGMPDFREIPGVPLRSQIKHGSGEMTVNTVAIKQDPLSDADFQVPKGYTDMLGGKEEE